MFNNSDDDKKCISRRNNRTDYRENLLTTPNPWAQLAALSHLTVALPAPPS